MTIYKLINDNNGQFLLYDMLLAISIILILLISTTYILETNSYNKINNNNYGQPEYLLELLEDEGLLSQLSTAQDTNDTLELNKTIEKIEYILTTGCKYNYCLYDRSNDKNIINHIPNKYTNVYSYRKTANNHEYVLKEYC